LGALKGFLEAVEVEVDLVANSAASSFVASLKLENKRETD
jgi:hypothetical protein